jgi:hypothetical protein
MGVAFATECAMIDKILGALRAKAIGMGEPPGTHGIAHVMKGAYLDDLYIKIKNDNNEVYVLCFHL